MGESRHMDDIFGRYPHDAKVELPDLGDFVYNNVGVLYDDNTEGYAWYGSVSGWWSFVDEIPENEEVDGDTYVFEHKHVIRWRAITDWAKEKEEHDRQSA
jgi:hypothetical protein